MSSASDRLPCKVKDIETPCLLVDLDLVENNARTMIARTQRLGLKLRPHMKTTKCLEAGTLMTNDTKSGIVVSTLAEAEFFADGGFNDILCAKLVTEDKMPRLQVLCERLSEFHVIVDAEETVTLLEKHSPDGGRCWSVFLFLDVGNNREGAIWDAESTMTLAKRLAQSSKFNFRGLYTHEGHSYKARGQHEIELVADQTADRLLHLANRLKAVGVECKDITLGATPTGSHPGEKVRQLTEIHPGNYVFYDMMQVEIGSCGVADIAAQVAARVIACYPQRRHLLVDAGWTALSKQGTLKSGSYAGFSGYPGLRLIEMTQEIGIVEVDTSQHAMDDFPLGTMLFLYPYHSCATAAMFRQYYVRRGDDVIDIWRPCCGW